MIKIFSLDLGCTKCVYVLSWKLIVLQDLMCKSAKFDRSKIRLDRSELVQIVFLQNFPTQPKSI